MQTRIIGATFVAVLLALGLSVRALDRAAAQDTVQAPRFEVDPMWPKPLPNGWLLGQTIGVGVDAKDHVWIVHRVDSLLATEIGAAQNPPTGKCCKPAPPVLEFDTDGTLLRSWGGPGQGYEWPVSNHGIFIDHKGIVWIGGNGNGDGQILKFTQDGKFVKEAFCFKKTLGDGAVWDVAFSKDPQQKYLFMADGKNERVRVLLRDTLELLTSFGDGGRQPGQFFAVHSIVTDSKGNLYTTETYEGRRLQKFVYKGIGAVPREQGVLWPGK